MSLDTGLLLDGVWFLDSGSEPEAVPFTWPTPDVRVAWRPDQFTRVANTGFETSAQSWSVSAGINGAGTSITRITTDAHSGIACGSLVCPATAGTGVNYDFGTQTFFQWGATNAVYRVLVWLKAVSGSPQATITLGSEGTPADRATRDISLTTYWKAYYVDWKPSANRTDVQLAITNQVAVAMTCRIDDVIVSYPFAMTQVANADFGTDTSGYTIAGGDIAGAATSLTRQTSGGFLGDTSGRLVTTSSNSSGTDFALGSTLFRSGRTFRLSARLRSISGSTSARLRLGSIDGLILPGIGVPDRGDSQTQTAVVLTADWTRYTVDWSPSQDRSDVALAITNGSAAVATFEIDDVQVYEALDDIGAAGRNDVQWLQFSRGSNFDGSSEAAGRATLRLLNPAHLYDPEYAPGALYGLLAPGRRIYIRADYVGASYALFHGSIRRFVPDPMLATVELVCEDNFHDLARTEYHSSWDSLPYFSHRSTMLTDTLIYRRLSTGPIESIYQYGGAETGDALSWLSSINVATGSVHFMRPQLHPLRCSEYVSIDRTTTSDGTSTVETWDDDLASLAGYDVTDEAVDNHQRVAVNGVEVGGVQFLVTAADPETYGSKYDGLFHFVAEDLGSDVPLDMLPLTIPANTKRVFTFDFLRPVDLSSTLTIIVGTGAVETSHDRFPRRSVVTLEAGSTDATIVQFGISGRLARTLPINDVESTDEDSIVAYGEQTRDRIDSPLISSIPVAEGLGDWHIWRYAKPRARPTAHRRLDFPSILEREVGDRVQLDFARLSITAKAYVIRGFETTVSAGSRDWVTVYRIEELPQQPVTWFTLDTSALGGTATLAY